MAGVLTLNVVASLVHSPISAQIFTANGLQIVTNTLGRHSAIVDVGTSEENMPVGDVATEGLLFLRNLDTTNFVTWGPDATGMVAIGQLNPGEIAVFRLKAGETLRWVADTATCKVEMYLLPD